MPRTPRIGLEILLLLALAVGGCATADGMFEHASNALSYASWRHFGFSAKASWQMLVRGETTATPEDVERAIREGWWGDEVLVAPPR